MANLRDIKGFTIQSVTTDPVTNVGTWSTGSALPQAMINQGSFGGRDTTTTGGGSTATAYVGDAFQYNGVAWSEIAELTTLRSENAGFGTQNAGAVAGGYSNAAPAGNRAFVENWNGTSWTEVADIPSNRVGAATAGTYTAGLYFGGNVPPSTNVSASWNGASWTATPSLNTARNRMNGWACGTQTAALCLCGIDPGRPGAEIESYNGSSWTEITECNTGRELGGGNGIQTSAIIAGGRTPAGPYAAITKPEQWDGTAWTEVNDLGTARAYMQSTGTAGGNPNQQSLVFGGATTSSTANTTATEEWSYPSGPSFLIEGQMWYNSASGDLKGYGVSVPTGAWASGASSPTGNNAGTSSKNGTQNAMMYAGGTSKECDQYNGTAWTEVAEFNSSSDAYRGGAGTSTATLIGGGEPSTTDAETFNGTSWTEVSELNLARYALGAFGTQTAGMVVGGRAGTDAGDGESETYNGTAWSEGDDLQNARRTYNSGAGVQTAGIMAGGGEPNKSDTELYNGTSWTEVSEMNTARSGAAMAGIQTSAIIFGGPNGPPYTGATEYYNGTSWTELADLSTGRGYSAGGGTAVAGLCMAGSDNSGATAVTEEWNASNAVLTVTTS